MCISAIEIKNIKGIDHKQFTLELMPNKPNLLVAPNGFGKSSIATAFASMNSRRMTLADNDHHKEDTNHQPELSITFNGQILTADASKNEIRQQIDVTVIRSGLVPKATRTYQGGATARLEIESIAIRKIPAKHSVTYQTSSVRSAFGVNGKVLPNISNLLQNLLLSEVVSGCDLVKYNGARLQQNVSSLIAQINEQTGTAGQIDQWITENLLNDFRAITPLKVVSENLLRLTLVSTETEAYLTSYQIAEIHKADNKSFEKAINWHQYIAEKKYYQDLIQSFCSSNWQWAKLSEDKKKKTLFVVFPQAHQLSNGQRDVLTLVVQMHKALYEGSKKPLVLVIDEVFDYLDDANLVAFQYYVTSLIQEYKNREQAVYPLILTHLDPGIFFDFCFNNHQIRTHYLQATSSKKCRDMLKLIEIRENDATDQSVKDHLDEFWFHFNPCSHEISEGEWPNALKAEWRKSEDFHAYVADELDRYMRSKNFDALAVCVAIRVTIESCVYSLLVTNEQKEKFISEHSTKKKLNYAAAHIPDIPEIYFLLGLIHNANLHWKQGKDYVTPLLSKLSHPAIKNLIAILGCETGGEI